MNINQIHITGTVQDELPSSHAHEYDLYFEVPFLDFFVWFLIFMAGFAFFKYFSKIWSR